MSVPEILQEFLETVSFDEERDWRDRPDLGEGDDDEEVDDAEDDDA